jgi:hypothetical protein
MTVIQKLPMAGHRKAAWFTGEGELRQVNFTFKYSFIYSPNLIFDGLDLPVEPAHGFVFLDVKIDNGIHPVAVFFQLVVSFFQDVKGFFHGFGFKNGAHSGKLIIDIAGFQHVDYPAYVRADTGAFVGRKHGKIYEY